MSQDFIGRSILIVADEPLIALDIARACERRGAVVVPAYSHAAAADRLEKGAISGAIVDFVLGDDHADALCRELERRCTPFILHSGHSDLTRAYHKGHVVAKPALADALLDVLGWVLSSPRGIDAFQAEEEIEWLRETTRQHSDDFARDRARISHCLAKSYRLVKSSKRNITASKALLERLAKTKQ
jgi:ActR/RegA family two-component response regulator